MSLPQVESGPTFTVDVTARDEDAAIDRAFDKAFADYPQFGAFKVDAVEQVDP
jgi:hypothetical protein